MASTKLHWLDHFDGSWSREDVETLVTRQGVVCLHQRLINNKEALPTQHAPLQLRGPNLPEYERGLINVSHEEQDEFLNQILYSQLSLARTVCADSPFYCTLRRRLEVLQRIFSALSNKFHNLSSSKPVPCSKNRNQDSCTSSSQDKLTPAEKREGSSVLIEMGIKTGLSLLFALFRQSWQLNSGQLCNDVLITASDVLSSLPPLSLANESKIPPLGQDCLKQITTFLKGVMSPSSAADVTGRQFACELLLRINILRGSLKYLLEWIEMVLNVTCSLAKNGKNPGSISITCLYEVLVQIRKSAVSIDLSDSAFNKISRSSLILDFFYLPHTKDTGSGEGA